MSVFRDIPHHIALTISEIAITVSQNLVVNVDTIPGDYLVDLSGNCRLTIEVLESAGAGFKVDIEVRGVTEDGTAYPLVEFPRITGDGVYTLIIAQCPKNLTIFADLTGGTSYKSKVWSTRV